MGKCGCGSGDVNEKKLADKEDFRKKVTEAIESIRPQLQMDGGDVKLVDVTDAGDVHVSLYGACATCPMAQMTLKMGIEQALRELVPEVRSVEAV
jgi:Fe-S cluster biogenesis protein NfuA